MENISETDLIKLMDESKTRQNNKDFFWLELKKKRKTSTAECINHHNLLIDIPNKEQRDTFIKNYSNENPNFDYFSGEDKIPEKYKEMYENNDNYKYPDFGIPLIIANIESVTSIKDVYIGILKSLCVSKSDLRIKNLEEMEYRLFHMIKTLSVEMIIINYSGDKLMPSKKLSSILYALCRLGELCKIPINLFGSISPRVFYSESVKVPIGSFYCIDGENNSKDISFTRVTMSLDKESGQMLETSREKVVI